MRKPMVTRTIENTAVNVLCMDVNTAEPENKEIVMSGTYKDNDKLMKAIRKEYETDDFKIVHIVDTDVRKELYGMDENKFLAEAVKLDPETRKPLD